MKRRRAFQLWVRARPRWQVVAAGVALVSVVVLVLSRSWRPQRSARNDGTAASAAASASAHAAVEAGDSGGVVPELPPYPEAENPCDRPPHVYDTARGVYRPLCINAEPIVASLLLDSGELWVAFSIFGLSESMIAQLGVEALPEQEQLSYTDSFVVISITLAGEAAVVHDYCPEHTRLVSLAMDQNGRLVTVCGEDNVRRTTFRYGRLEPGSKRLVWYAKQVVNDLPINMSIPVTLGFVAGRPVLLVNHGEGATIVFPNNIQQVVDSPYVVLAGANQLTVVGQNAADDPPRYILTVFSATGSRASATLRLRTVQRPAVFDWLEPFLNNEPSVFATLAGDTIEVPLPDPAARMNFVDVSTSRVFSRRGLRIVGGARVVGSGVELFERNVRDEALWLRCSDQRQPKRIAERYIRDPRASCTASSCLVTYTKPLQLAPSARFGLERWQEPAFQVRHIDRQSCDDIAEQPERTRDYR